MISARRALCEDAVLLLCKTCRCALIIAVCACAGYLSIAKHMHTQGCNELHCACRSQVPNVLDAFRSQLPCSTRHVLPDVHTNINLERQLFRPPDGVTHAPTKTAKRLVQHESDERGPGCQIATQHCRFAEMQTTVYIHQTKPRTHKGSRGNMLDA